MVYIDFPKMERNGGRIMKFREDTTLLSLLGSALQFWIQSWELCWIGEES